MIRPCARCERDYETDDFGTGPKYCSAACRNNLHEAKEKYILNGEQGRPNKFGRPEWWMLSTVVRYFEGNGWRVSRVRQPDDPGPKQRIATYHDKKARYRLQLNKSWFKVNLCIAGWYRNEKWAHVVAYFVDGTLLFASTCQKLKVEGVRGGSPCESDLCKKCSKLHLLTQLVNKRTAPYALAAQARRDPRI
jgi:hypothetical protein